MDPANRREALAEVKLDVEEGADIVIVKPAMSHLDILADVAAVSSVPVAAYQLSGEYAMIEAAAANGWIDRREAVMESLLGIKRARCGHDPHQLGKQTSPRGLRRHDGPLLSANPAR